MPRRTRLFCFSRKFQGRFSIRRGFWRACPTVQPRLGGIESDCVEAKWAAPPYLRKLQDVVPFARKLSRSVCIPPPPPKTPRTTPFHALFGRLKVGGTRRGEPLQSAEKPCFSSPAALRKVKRDAYGTLPRKAFNNVCKYAHRFTRPAKKLPQPPLLARASKCYAPLPAGTRGCGVGAVGMASTAGILKPKATPLRRGFAPPRPALTGG